MKSLLTPLVIALLSIGAAACDSASKGTSSTVRTSSDPAGASTTAPASDTTTPNLDPTKPDADMDNDPGAAYDDTNNNSVLNYGHPATAADKQAVTALLKRYYAAAASNDGAQDCTMLLSSLAAALPADFGPGATGPAYLRKSTTCPTIMKLLFEHNHGLLSLESPKLEVKRVRLVGHRGLAILGFGTMPERQISVSREGHTWKISELLDSELP